MGQSSYVYILWLLILTAGLGILIEFRSLVQFRKSLPASRSPQ